MVTVAGPVMSPPCTTVRPKKAADDGATGLGTPLLPMNTLT
jgi:hypothetical protein